MLVVVEVVVSVSESDISNNGNGSDLEVNWIKQENESSIREYRILVMKVGRVQEMTLSSALDNTNYTTVDPSDVILFQGTFLTSGTTDTDGDLISEQHDYRIGILSLVKNRDSFLNDLTIS